MEKHQEVFIAVKRIIGDVELRNADLALCCPLRNDDEEERTLHLRKLAKSQQEIDESIQYFRDVTENRFKDFSNVEISFIVHLWSGIWASPHKLRLDSSEIMTIIGHNRIEEAADFICSMIHGTSPLFAYISMHWKPDLREGNGDYLFLFHNLDGFHRMLFGND